MRARVRRVRKNATRVSYCETKVGASATTALAGTNFGIRNRQQGTGGAPFTSTVDDVQVNAVPEPGAGMLLGLSAGLLGFWRRRKSG
jgi:hypothetical protein